MTDPCLHILLDDQDRDDIETLVANGVDPVDAAQRVMMDIDREVETVLAQVQEQGILNQAGTRRHGRNFNFTSPNEQEDLTLREAYTAMTREKQRKLVDYTQRVDSFIGLKGDVVDGIGDWADGAENTTVDQIGGAPSYAKIQLGAALKGLFSKQKNTIAFKADRNGGDAVYDFVMPLNLRGTRHRLQQLGIENRTLTPMSENETRVVLFDPGAELLDTVEKIANEESIDINVIPGKGEFLGDPDWSSREVAADRYREVVEKELRKLEGFGEYDQLRNLTYEALKGHQRNGIPLFYNTVSRGKVSGKPALLKALNPGNVGTQALALERFGKKHKDPLVSEKAWLKMERDLTGSNVTPIAPLGLIDLVNNTDRWIARHNTLTPRQLAAASKGFELIEEFGQLYKDGTVDVYTTARLMMWGMMSRTLSTHPHESAFVDLAYNEGTMEFIQRTLDHQWTDTDIREYRDWAATVIPEYAPGKSATVNMNSFGDTFLAKMSRRMPDGRSALEHLHDMMINQAMPSREIRRQYYGLSEGAVIQNKVLSFMLLISGREDVMVLDRIQINSMWDAGRYGRLIYDEVAPLFEGAHGLARYEALERSLLTRLGALYEGVGRPQDASVGRYHWESWVRDSGQVVAHPTIKMMSDLAVGKHSSFADIGAPEGRYHTYAYGSLYARDDQGAPYILYADSKSDVYKFHLKDFKDFLDEVQKPRNGIVPKRFKVTTYRDLGYPWYEAEEVNRDELDKLIAARSEGRVLERTRAVQAAAEATNPDVPGVLAQSGGGTVGSSGQLPVRDDGRVPLTHWGRAGGLTTLDPAQQGTGAAGRETQRAGRPARTYYGLPGYNAKRDTGVTTVGQHHYFTTLDPAELYDLSSDPDDLAGRVRDQKEQANKIPGLVVTVTGTDLERAVQDAGYKGYWVDNPQLGPVAAVFEPLEVESIKPTNEAIWGTEELDQPIVEQARRAYFEVQNRIIRLTEASDLSSFLHESAHFFLEMEKQFAEEFGVDQVQQDLLDWLGVDSFEGITRAEHERFAETFEVYLREGKAPSLGLREAFRAFKQWLIRIYQGLTDPRLGNADLSPEIVGVFDRLLATEAEIQRARANPIYDEFFQSPDQLGMTDQEWEKLQKQREKVVQAAQETLDEKAIKAYTQMIKREWAEEKAPIYEAELEKQWELPVNQARAAAAAFKMDSAEVQRILGTTKIPPQLLRYVMKEGADPGEYAGNVGYLSAEEMLADMINQPTAKKAAEEAAEVVMVQRNGDIFNDGTVQAEAANALQNEEQAKLLMMQVNALAKKAGKPKVDREYLQAKARDAMLSMTYKQIQPGKFRRQEIRAARQLGAAQDDETRFNLMVKMLSNHYLYNEAMSARDQMTKDRRRARNVQTRTYDTRQVNHEHVAQMKALVEMYDLRQLGKDDAIKKLREILEWVDGQITGETTLDITPYDLKVMEGYVMWKNGESFENFDLPTFDEMTYEQMRSLAVMLDHLRFVGGKVMEGTKEAFTADKERLVESIHEKGGADAFTPGVPGKHDDKIKDAEQFLYNLTSLRNMVRKMDGFEEDGAATQLLYNLVDHGNSEKMRWGKTIYDLFETHMGDLHRVGLRRDDKKSYRLENGSTWELSSESRFMFALYWGTETSRDALRNGFGITDNDAAMVMADMTPEQLRLVNAKWALNEQIWPYLAEVTKEYDGVVPPKLEAAPFEVNGVRMTGGHMRMFYDSSYPKLKNEAEDTSVGSRSSVVTHKAGSMFARTGSAGMPPLLDKNNMIRELNDNVHYLSFGPVSRRLSGLVNSRDVADAITQKHGQAFYQVLIDNLTKITGNKHERESVKLMARISRTLRHAATMKHLAYSIRNTVQQFSVATITAQEVGPIEFIGRMLDYARRPGEIEAFVREKDPWMDNRATVVNREASEFLNKITAAGEVDYWYQRAMANGFILQTFVDRMFAFPVWMARYESEMQKHGDEARAITAAHVAVAESVGAGDDLHLGGIMHQGNPEWVKAATVFGSWFNTYFQRVYRDIGRARANPSVESITQAMATAVAQPIIVGIISALLIMDYPDEEDDVEDWLKWSGGESAKFLAGTVPIVREMTSAFEGFSPRSPYGDLITAPSKAYSQTLATIEGRESAFKSTLDSLKILTGLVPVPGSGQLLRVGDHLDAVAEGEDDFHLYQMFVEGRNRND